MVRPLSPAPLFDSAADSGELQVLRLKISGGLVKRRQRLPPVVDEKRAVDFPSGVFSVILGGGRLWWGVVVINSEGIKTDYLENKKLNGLYITHMLSKKTD